LRAFPVRDAALDDHLNRGKNMDTRTPQADIRFVA
jgi:hypothetical protein